MLRIYFDKQVYSYLNNPENYTAPELQDRIDKLSSLLDENLDHIVVPFSSAHADDLKNNWDKNEKTILLTERDLGLISKLSHNYGIQIKAGKEAEFYIESPKYVFDVHKDKYLKGIDIEVDHMFDFIEDVEVRKYLKKSISTAYDSKFKTPINLEDADPERVEMLKEAMPWLFGPVSIRSIMNGVVEQMFNSKTSDGLFITLKDFIAKHLPEIEQLNEYQFLNRIDTLFEDENVKQKFRNYIHKLIHVDGQEQSSFLLYVIMTYFMLDYFKIIEEKRRKMKRSRFENIYNDGQHIYFAAYCDYFISDDSKLVEKANAIYKLYNLDTKALSIAEFIDRFENKILEYTSQKEFFDSIVKIISDSKGLELEYIEEYELYTGKRQVKKCPLNYFDVLSYVKDKNNDIHLVFDKQRESLYPYPLFIEIEYLVNQLFKLLGKDSQDEGAFDAKEKQDIIEKKWKGRHWDLNTFTAEICINAVTNCANFIMKVYNKNGA